MSDTTDKTERLSAYLDGELSDEQTREVAEALQHDPALAEELRSLRATRDLLRGLPRDKAPEDLPDRILAQAERNLLVDRPSAATRAPRLRWARYAAAAAVLIVAGGVIAIIVDAMRTAGRYDDETQTVHEAPVDEDVPVVRRDGDAEPSAPADGREGDARDAAGSDGEEIAFADGHWAERADGRRGKAAGPAPETRLAGGAGGAKPAKAGAGNGAALLSVAARNNLELTVHDMSRGQRDVEAFLRENGIEPVRTTEVVQRAARARGNFYYNQCLNGSEQYVAFVPRDELDRYKRKIARRVSMSQLALYRDDVNGVAPAGRSRTEAADKPAAQQREQPSGGDEKLAKVAEDRSPPAEEETKEVAARQSARQAAEPEAETPRDPDVNGQTTQPLPAAKDEHPAEPAGQYALTEETEAPSPRTATAPAPSRPASEQQRPEGLEDRGRVADLPGGQAAADALRRELSQVEAAVEPLIITLNATPPDQTDLATLLRQMDLKAPEADDAANQTAPHADDAPETGAPAGQ